MSRKNRKDMIMDADGIEVGTEMNANQTITKSFKLSRRSADWPTDSEGKPVELEFTLHIDMRGVEYRTILDDAIRTKVIACQNALRGTCTKTPPSFATLHTLSEQDLHRSYDNCAKTPENPEKELANVKASIDSMSPEMKRQLMEQLLAQA